MNATIEVAAIQATVILEMAEPKVRIANGFFAEVVFTTQVVATSILRTLRQGRSSLSAIPGNAIYNLNGGEAVAF